MKLNDSWSRRFLHNFCQRVDIVINRLTKRLRDKTIQCYSLKMYIHDLSRSVLYYLWLPCCPVYISWRPVMRRQCWIVELQHWKPRVTFNIKPTAKNVEGKNELQQSYRNYNEVLQSLQTARTRNGLCYECCLLR